MDFSKIIDGLMKAQISGGPAAGLAYMNGVNIALEEKAEGQKIAARDNSGGCQFYQFPNSTKI